MPYHMWYLACSDDCVPFHEFPELVGGLGEQYTLALTEGTDKVWAEISLAHVEDEHPIGDLRRYPVRPGVPNDPGAQEIAYFLEEIEDAEPACNVPWLRQFLPTVQTVYVWSLYSGTDVGDGWDPVRDIEDVLVDGDETAVYAEHEGWTNTDGNHITWEFSDKVSGVWWMGLHLDGRWHRFQMELSDRKARKSFRQGKVPAGVEVFVDGPDSTGR